MDNGWVMVYSSEFDYIIELARGILEQNDIKSIVLNKKDTVQPFILNAYIELYVSNENETQAKFHLSKMIL